MPAPMQLAKETRTRPSRAQLLTMFREIASEVVEKDFHAVTESMVVGQLDIDSLGMLEIIGSLERGLRIQIQEESLAGMETIQDLLDEVEKRLE